MESKVIRIIVLEDQEVQRKGLISILNSFNNIKVIAEASNGKELIDLLEKHECDIVLTDIMMEGMDGNEVARIVLSKYPQLILAAISNNSNELDLQSIIEAGGKGYILKSASRIEIETAINILYNGGCYYSKELLSFFIDKFITKNRNPKTKFTEIELEVLKLLAKDCSNEEIEKELCLSPFIVNSHKSNLIEKIGSKTVFDLLVYIIKNNMV